MVYQYKIPPPQTVSQESYHPANSKIDQLEIRPIEDQYLVIFHERWHRARTPQVAGDVRAFTDHFLKEIDIPTDSVIAHFEYALRGFTARMDENKAKSLMDDSRVDYVEQDRRFRAINFSAGKDTTLSQMSSQTTPWGVSRVAGPLDGTGKRAWILDTGIDLSHSDLNISSQHNISFIPGENANDLKGHGTHVAGILAAKNNGIDVVGVAAGATVVSVKVLDRFGDGTTSSVVNGVNHVVANASTNDIVNMSLGAYDPHGTLTTIDQAVENAANAGFRIVVAAGNDEVHANNVSPARVIHNNIWSISATNSNNEFATTFSNFGNPPIRFAAPGVNVLSLKIGGGATIDKGTSMSTPHVAGILLVCGESGLGSSGTAINDPSPPADPIARANIPTFVSNVTQSVVQNPINPSYQSPKLDWNAVSGATGYEIQRRHWQFDWKNWGAPTATTFTDIMTMSQNLQVYPWQGQPFNYWVAYRVRAVNACGVGSWSQVKYFTFDPNDSIPTSFEEGEEIL